MTPDFKALYLPGQNPDPTYKAEHALAYQLWSAGWKEALRKLGVGSQLYSDAFTRQDEVGALFANETCIGLVLYRWVDTSAPGFRDDSYFKVWSDDDIATLSKSGHVILIPSYLTVHPEWRQIQGHGIQTKRLLMDFMVRRFLDSPAAAMSSTTRNTRGINDIAYELGATPIRQNVAHFSEQDPVDLVVTYRTSAKLAENFPLRPFAERLWAKRTYVTTATSLRSTAEPRQRDLSKAS